MITVVGKKDVQLFLVGQIEAALSGTRSVVNLQPLFINLNADRM